MVTAFSVKYVSTHPIVDIFYEPLKLLLEKSTGKFLKPKIKESN